MAFNLGDKAHLNLGVDSVDKEAECATTTLRRVLIRSSVPFLRCSPNGTR